MRRLATVTLLSAAAVVGGCTSLMPPAVTPRPGGGDPRAVYASVRRNAAAVTSLRARFSAEMRRGEEQRAAEGVLLVKKPDRFRIRLLSAFGFTIFDYTTDDAHAHMALPLEGKEFSDADIAVHASFSPAEMRDLFLRDDPGEERCIAKARGAETLVQCTDPDGGLERQLFIQSDTETLTREIAFTDGHPRVVMEFAEYRSVSGVRLPFHIALTYPQRNVSLQIAARAYEVNPVLPDDLFDGAGAAAVSR